MTSLELSTKRPEQFLYSGPEDGLSSVNVSVADNQYHLTYHAEGQPNNTGSFRLSFNQNTNLQVEWFRGKGGETMVIFSPSGANYFALPGSKIQLKEVSLEYAGPALKPLKNTQSIHQDIHQITGTKQGVTRQAMILGAGLATRFEPISGDRTGFSKPAVPLYDDVSVIKAIADQLVKHGITKILINTFYKPTSLKAGLNSVQGAEIIYIDEPSPSGTAGALHNAINHPERNWLDLTQPILVVQGDAVTNADFSQLLNAHQVSGASVSIGCQMVSDEDVNKFGIVTTDKCGGDSVSGRIMGFMEKPSLENAGSHRLANTGFYIFSPQTFDWFQQAHQKKQAQSAESSIILDFALDIFPLVLEKASNNPEIYFLGQAVTGFWSDIGNPAQYIQTVRAVYEGCLSCQPKAEMAIDSLEFTFVDEQGVIFWPGARTLANLDNAVLSGNVVVTAKKANS
ncbi:MAG: nucleotidyltransferase family protein [Cyanobacteria bacterium]|nr:nucleotidyltransferase family protein [Cyanobacteriota bacterium]